MNANKLCKRKAILFKMLNEKKSAIEIDTVASKDEVIKALSFNIENH